MSMTVINDAGRRIRARYAAIQQNRGKTILMSNQEFHNLHQNHHMGVVLTKKPKDVKEPKPPKEQKEQCVCKAIKLSGMPCTSKVVGDSLFCKRHSKK